MDLGEFAHKLRDDFGIQVDWFSLSSMDGYDELMELASQPYSVANCGKLFRFLKNFQKRTDVKTYLTEMLTIPEVFHPEQKLPNDRDTYERQVSHLRASAKRQEIIRILIDISMSSEDIDRLISAFSSTLG